MSFSVFSRVQSLDSAVHLLGDLVSQAGELLHRIVRRLDALEAEAGRRGLEQCESCQGWWPAGTGHLCRPSLDGAVRRHPAGSA